MEKKDRYLGHRDATIAQSIVKCRAFAEELQKGN